eukprot:3292647-Pleurochrysis_carterae.AAC.1
MPEGKSRSTLILRGDLQNKAKQERRSKTVRRAGKAVKETAQDGKGKGGRPTRGARTARRARDDARR